jgi:hypothetical protein
MSKAAERFSMKTAKGTEYAVRLVVVVVVVVVVVAAVAAAAAAVAVVVVVRCATVQISGFEEFIMIAEGNSLGHDVVDFSFVKQKLNQHRTFVEDLITTRECTLKSAGVSAHKFPRSTLFVFSGLVFVPTSSEVISLSFTQ